MEPCIEAHIPPSDETEVAEIALEEDISSQGLCQIDDTDELMDWVFGEVESTSEQHDDSINDDITSEED